MIQFVSLGVQVPRMHLEAPFLVAVFGGPRDFTRIKSHLQVVSSREPTRVSDFDHQKPSTEYDHPPAPGFCWAPFSGPHPKTARGTGDPLERTPRSAQGEFPWGMATVPGTSTARDPVAPQIMAGRPAKQLSHGCGP